MCITLAFLQKSAVKHFGFTVFLNANVRTRLNSQNKFLKRLLKFMIELHHGKPNDKALDSTGKELSGKTLFYFTVEQKLTLFLLKKSIKVL